MRLANILIDKTGALIYPLTQVDINVKARQNITLNHQITLLFYNNIVTSQTGVITPVDPVITGLTGSVIIQARADINDFWTNIEDGTVDISTSNKCFPAGIIQSIKITPTGVTGCNYILALVDGGI